MIRLTFWMLLLCIFASRNLAAAPPPPSEEERTAKLAKELQNPVSSLISVPLQNNVDLGFGANRDGVRYTLNIQPVIPFNLSPDWNMISRTILPIIDQHRISGLGKAQAGLGDTTQSLFFSPTKPGPGGLIWGLGPVFSIPTASQKELGSEQFGIGPTLVLVQQHAGWTYGVLTNHVFSVAGHEDRADISNTFIQPFISYTTKKAFTTSLNMESSYDWIHDQWLIPVNLQFSQLVKVGGQAMSVGVGGRYYAESPAEGPNWGARLTVTLLFPEK